MVAKKQANLMIAKLLLTGMADVIMSSNSDFAAYTRSDCFYAINNMMDEQTLLMLAQASWMSHVNSDQQFSTVNVLSSASVAAVRSGETFMDAQAWLCLRRL